MFKKSNLVEKVFCKHCGVVGYNITISEELNCPVGQLVCGVCGLGIDLNNKHNTSLLECSEIIELQLATMKLTDRFRLKQQIKNSSINLKTRENVKKHKKQKLYKETKDSFTFGGVYYKQNIETGDYFLSEFSYGTKKYYQKESDNKVRNSSNFGLKGSNYKKLYDIEWKLI